MEQIFRILKQLTSTAGMLGSIPKPIRIAMTYLGAFVAVVAIFKYAKLSTSDKTFLIIALILLGIITAGYYAWKAWTQRQHNQQFGGEIAQHSSATPRGLSDPGQRARLDDMRKKFQSGVEAYKSRGKDLYKLPWYVFVGEPGSGKTEAIRHCNVGFPPGMQDEFQGVGGTINMNWWFTNHAVLLDTAGRLMFEDVKAGETNEWKEFLTLLKKNRPNCPINGLFLIIPSDSLIKDSADSIQKKAGKIAQQLDVIQRVLDVRFPVFVVVTKCDRINGFREFFDGLTDPQLQHQMMGWSNPDPLDEPFKPEIVDKHLEQVGARLRRRRLGLLRDPVPENSDGRRTDEVDSLYALPHSLELLSSRLRRYLETIFIAGEWSAKPLFLRGIYFSSSMREGAALDAELAEAIGVSVEDLPEGKVWERDRAYFLRDLFVEKVFREKSLVTRASNTKHMLRSQQIALYSFGFVSLLAFAAIAWFAKGNLRGSVKDQSDYWQTASAVGWEQKIWKQSLLRPRSDGSYVEELNTNLVAVGERKMTIGEFLAGLREKAERPLKRNWIFPTLADTYNHDRLRAQRIVLEGAVVKPALDAARWKMKSSLADTEPNPWLPGALVALIQLEADRLSSSKATNSGVLTTSGATNFLAPLLGYVTKKDALDSNVVTTLAATYKTEGSWPPGWAGGAPTNAVNSLTNNPAIQNGLQVFLSNATNISAQLVNYRHLTELQTNVAAFENAERKLHAAAQAGDAAKFDAAQKEIEPARAIVDNEASKLVNLPIFGGKALLAGAYQTFEKEIKASAAAALKNVKSVNDLALKTTSGHDLFKDIGRRIEEVEKAVQAQMTQLVNPNAFAEYQRLDDEHLADHAYAKRANLYAKAQKLMTQRSFDSGKLVGSKGKQLEELLTNEITPLEAEAAAYAGKLTNELNRTIRYQLRRAEKLQSDEFFKAYLAEAKKRLAADGGFPLIRDLVWITPADKFVAAYNHLKNITGDLVSTNFVKYKLRDRPDWKAFIESVEGQQKVATALCDDDGSFGTSIISLAGTTDATRMKDAWRATWRNMRLSFAGGNSEWIRTESDEKIGDVPVQQKVDLLLNQNVLVPNSPTFTIPTAEWGPLWLIHRYKGERDKIDPKVWLVEFPVGAPGATGSVRLKLKFDHVLPELDKWPAQ